MNTQLICRKCGEPHDIDDFYLTHRGKRDGTCKYCRIKSVMEKYNSNPYRSWAKNTKAHHESKGVVVDFSMDELERVARIHDRCMLCGKPLHYGRKENGNTSDNSPTLTSVNNSNHIDKNSVFVLCIKCNSLMQNRSMVELLDFCRMIIHKFG